MLFKANSESTTVHLNLQVEDFYEPIGDLKPKVVDVLATELEFLADERTIRFYSPKKSIGLDAIEDEFIEEAGDTTLIARKCQPTLDVDLVLGNPEDLDRTLHHLLVTAEVDEAKQDYSTQLAPLNPLLRRSAASCQETAVSAARFDAGSKFYDITFLSFNSRRNLDSSTAHFVVQADDFDKPVRDLVPKIVDVLGVKFNYNAEENDIDFWVETHRSR
ncbi:hypothetical protein EIP91_010088 [Steccherinum ochraceum]|uniref:Uncharacterized protein n=1 Tax=Steccherinum ochraceum TaxID=92696 RepID=A0A4R0RVZ7_9APHY|nr:hypothetical protein EIP91_010088 [Steccherinum ochraceum]